MQITRISVLMLTDLKGKYTCCVHVTKATGDWWVHVPGAQESFPYLTSGHGAGEGEERKRS